MSVFLGGKSFLFGVWRQNVAWIYYFWRPEKIFNDVWRVEVFFPSVWHLRKSFWLPCILETPINPTPFFLGQRTLDTGCFNLLCVMCFHNFHMSANRKWREKGSFLNLNYRRNRSKILNFYFKFRRGNGTINVSDTVCFCKPPRHTPVRLST